MPPDCDPIIPANLQLDSALAALSCIGPELANGMTNHAPMVAEALETLGRPDAIEPMINRTRSMLRPWPEATRPVGDWHTALGNVQRAADWRVLFDAEIATGGWRAALARWVPRLAPAASADALHGLIRVGHAARSLSRTETDARRLELAAAMASWAAAYAELPVAAEAGPSAHEPAVASLARVPLLPPHRRRNDGSIVAALAQLSHDDAFARAFHWPAIADADLVARQLGALFARVLAANVDSVLHAIVFTHGVTGCAAARNLLPHMGADDGRALVRHVWHAGCALYVVYGSRPPAPRAQPTPALAGLVDRAVGSGDDHAIKLAEAVLSLEMDADLAGAALAQALHYFERTDGM